MYYNRKFSLDECDDCGYDPRDDEEQNTNEGEFETCPRCDRGCNYCLMLEY